MTTTDTTETCNHLPADGLTLGHFCRECGEALPCPRTNVARDGHCRDCGKRVGAAAVEAELIARVMDAGALEAAARASMFLGRGASQADVEAAAAEVLAAEMALEAHRRAHVPEAVLPRARERLIGLRAHCAAWPDDEQAQAVLLEAERDVADLESRAR